MKPRISFLACTLALLLATAGSLSAAAEFELTFSDLQKTNRQGELVLTLERRIERDRACRFSVRLTNRFPYEVENLVLYYSAYRADGVIYDTVSSGHAFASLKPGDTQTRDFEFFGVACRDIVRVQVVGGDRCNMGDLNRWSDQSKYKGECLARVRVEESKLLRFDK